MNHGSGAVRCCDFDGDVHTLFAMRFCDVSIAMADEGFEDWWTCSFLEARNEGVKINGVEQGVELGVRSNSGLEVRGVAKVDKDLR